MEKGLIYLKKGNQNYGLIKMVSNSSGITNYSYYNYNISIDEPRKSTFNRNSFAEFLSSIQIPKKYIKMVENY